MIVKLQSVLSRICIVGTSSAFAVLIFAVLVQVVGRTIGSSPVWTEELTRFALLYLAAFGVGLSLNTGDLVNVDVLCENLPGRLPRILRLISATLTVVFAAALIIPAYKFTKIGNFQHSPALNWRMDYIHASILVLLTTLALFGAFRLALMLSGKSTGEAKPLFEKSE